MLGKQRRNREIYLWIAGACVAVFIVVVVVALLLDATGAIGGKRLASHRAKERAAIVVPVRPAPVVRMDSSPVVRVRALPIVSHSTTTSTMVTQTDPAASLRQAPVTPRAPLPPATQPPVTTPATLSPAPLPSVSAQVHLSEPAVNAAARVRVVAHPAPALPQMIGGLTAQVELHLRIG